MDNSKKLDAKTNETIEKIKGNKNIFQLILFVAFSSIAAIAQLGSRVIIDLLLESSKVPILRASSTASSLS